MRFVNGGDLIAETLSQEGVDCFVGVIGGQLVPFFDAIGRNSSLRLVVPRNEGAGVMIADGYTRASSGPACAISTVGAGLVYAMAGIALARADCVPLISISPQVQTWRIYPDQGSLQGCYQAEAVRGAARWNCMVYNWNRIPQLVERGIREATSGEKGPVHLDVPVDVMYEFHLKTAGALRRLLNQQGRSRFSGGFAPDPVHVTEALALIKKSRRPIVIAGLSVLRESAFEAVSSFAEKMNAPVMVTPAAISALSSEHPCYAGIAGHYESKQDGAFRRADLLILLGATAAEIHDLAGAVDCKGKKIIQTTPEPELAGSFGFINAALTGDIGSITEKLLKGLKAAADGRWLKTCTNEYWNSVKKMKRGKGAAVALLGELLAPDDSMILDGDPVYSGMMLCPPRACNSRFVSRFHGSRGYGLPLALGVKLARPENRVFLLCDTESLLQHVQELDTARREGIAITLCVTGERYSWKEVAEGFGLVGACASNADELIMAVNTAASFESTVLIDMTDYR